MYDVRLKTVDESPQGDCGYRIGKGRLVIGSVVARKVRDSCPELA
jgi:hypothetical protein